MKHEKQVVTKRWIPILEEYERTRTKIKPRAFKSVNYSAKPIIYRPGTTPNNTASVTQKEVQVGPPSF